MAVRIWLARNIETPLREQIVAQMVLAILSGDVRAGQRLPSTRDLARRLKVHSNTVSAAYRELEREDWVEFRRGSGVYVRSRTRRKPLPPGIALDGMITDFLRAARKQGASLAQIRSRLGHWLALQPPDHFLVIEPDEELRRILVAEIQQSAGFPVSGAGLEACGRPETLGGAVPVVLLSKFEKVRGLLPADSECLALHVRSIPGSMAQWMPIPRDALIAVASRWRGFLAWAGKMLPAAGIDADALDFRDARKRRWQDGLRVASAVIADVVTARDVPRGCRVIVFRLIADASLAELRSFRDFLTGLHA